MCVLFRVLGCPPWAGSLETNFRDPAHLLGSSLLAFTSQLAHTRVSLSAFLFNTPAKEIVVLNIAF